MHSPDYQQFELGADGPCAVGQRMKQKLDAIPLPNLQGKAVLDIGCDHGFWSWTAVSRGAAHVVGIDRNRDVKGIGPVDLVAQNQAIAEARRWPARFLHQDLGRQWAPVPGGPFDVVFLFSLYHHIYANCGDHRAIWFWLRQCMHDDSMLLWENPLGLEDSVANHVIPREFKATYNPQAILEAAGEFFSWVRIGPARHEPHREVYLFTPKLQMSRYVSGQICKGAGGASPAFQYAEGRRMDEIQQVLGMRPWPGTLNVRLCHPFDWKAPSFPARILDVVDRPKGLESAWAPRAVRFYPITIEDRPAYVIRFDIDHYSEKLIGVVCNLRLRDVLQGEVRVIQPWSGLC